MQQDLTRGPIRVHLWQLALPASIGYLFHTLFNVTDTWFAGNLSTQAVAALSLTFAIFFVLIAVAGGMSQAVTAVLGNALGKGDRQQASAIIGHAWILALALAVLLTGSGWLAAPHLLRLLGAEGDYHAQALHYIRIILLGASFFVGCFFSNAMLNAIGNTRAFRNFLIGAFFLNILCDYALIHGRFGLPQMGVDGIAMATVLVEALGMLYLLSVVIASGLFRDLLPFRPRWSLMRELLLQGFPPTVNMVLIAAGMFVITFFIAPLGQHVVAAYGIALRIEQLILLPSIGINVAVLSLVAQNNGAGCVDRIRETRAYALRLGLILWLAGSILLVFGGRFLVSLFSEDAAVIAAGYSYLIAATFALYAYMLVFINSSVLQGIKHPHILIPLGLLRQLLIPALLFSLCALLELPLFAYWWVIVVVIWVSAVFMLWYTRRKLDGVHQGPLIQGG